MGDLLRVAGNGSAAQMTPRWASGSGHSWMDRTLPPFHHGWIGKLSSRGHGRTKSEKSLVVPEAPAGVRRGSGPTSPEAVRPAPGSRRVELSSALCIKYLCCSTSGGRDSFSILGRFRLDNSVLIRCRGRQYSFRRRPKGCISGTHCRFRSRSRIRIQRACLPFIRPSHMHKTTPPPPRETEREQ